MNKDVDIIISKLRAIEMLQRYKPKMIHRSKKNYNRRRFKQEHELPITKF
jgi:hypothetical protein